MPLREAATAAVLSVLVPGTGHLYLGRARRFVAPLAVFGAVVVLLGALGRLSTLHGFAVAALMAVGLAAFAVIDGAILGARAGRSAPKWYMRWFVLAAWVLVCVAVTSLWVSVREPVLGYAIYRIPGASMRPTLVPGDIILVDTRMSARSDLPPNTMVVFRRAETGLLNVLRIKEQTGPGTFSLSNGLRFAPSLEGVPRESITGVVTALLWSPERNELGRQLK